MKKLLTPFIFVIVAIAGITAVLYYNFYLNELITNILLGLFSAFIGSAISLLFIIAVSEKKRKTVNLKKLINALKTDPGYYESWQSNIAMAFYDEYSAFRIIKAKKKKEPSKIYLSRNDIHIVANEAARNFLNQLMS